MSRYIDADALVTDISFFDGDKYHYGYSQGMINAAPTVDSVPVVHGEWIFDGKFMELHKFHCSKCMRTGMIISRKKFEQEIANARNEVLRQNELDYRFGDVCNRVDDTNRRIYDLERRLDTLYAELHPEQEKKHGRTEISCCGK